ncbi:hypothetical protein BD324DRAFT_136908 [Kockovaella imperatae]|uniref:BZIP domain-containing protein n=1 Tax=Kockovaella imperatae TaxID=4999 RepID=A0A1Y1U9Z4_9TREE|nr:hypothetical protein BD324DRAFT_136908 [Kockovaella imperatae]ORX34832.1 hypothetical protein BD324DRAFT_136908 [Kockovaella imperatae]
MPTKLGAADSFNSSGATIIPDREQRGSGPTYRAYNPIAGLSNARLLMPEDSFGRQLQAFLTSGSTTNDSQQETEAGGQSGDSVRPNINDEAAEAMLRDFGFNSSTSSHFTTHTPNPSDLISSLQIDSNAAHTHARTSPFNSHSPLAQEEAASLSATASGNHPDRPASVLSHHSHHSHASRSHRGSISGSEYSYTSTEVSGDEDVRMEADVPEPLQTVWNVGAIGGVVPALGSTLTANPFASKGGTGHAQYPSPVSTSGPSPPTVPGAMFGGGAGAGAGAGGGPVRGIGAEKEEEERKRLERLEHRRDINRRSAQKHRAARKAELDILNRTITEKEARISQLERELAVEQSKSRQLAEFIKMSMGRGRTDDEQGEESIGDKQVVAGSRRVSSRRGAT